MENSPKNQVDLSINESFDIIQKRRTVSKNRQITNWYILGLVGNIGLSIAIPIALGGYIGSQIDAKYTVYPTSTRLGLGIGIGISFLGFVTIIRQAYTYLSKK